LRRKATSGEQYHLRAHGHTPDLLARHALKFFALLWAWRADCEVR
jgi:hypothetical protein